MNPHQIYCSEIPYNKKNIKSYQRKNKKKQKKPDYFNGMTESRLLRSCKKSQKPMEGKAEEK